MVGRGLPPLAHSNNKKITRCYDDSQAKEGNNWLLVFPALEHDSKLPVIATKEQVSDHMNYWLSMEDRTNNDLS